MRTFDDEILEKKFEKAKEMYETFRYVASRKVNLNEPKEIINQLTELNAVAHVGAECEAMFEYLNDKHAMKKLGVLDMDTRGAAEKKIILSSEIGSTSFWLTLTRLMIKESHYSSDRLRSALSYLKQEMSTI